MIAARSAAPATLAPDEVVARWSALLSACDHCVKTDGAGRQALRLRLQAAKAAGSPFPEAHRQAERLIADAWSIACLGDRNPAPLGLIEHMRTACEGLRPFLPAAPTHAVRSRADLDG